MHHRDAQGPPSFFEIQFSHSRPIKGLNLRSLCLKPISIIIIIIIIIIVIIIIIIIIIINYYYHYIYYHCYYYYY